MNESLRQFSSVTPVGEYLGVAFSFPFGGGVAAVNNTDFAAHNAEGHSGTLAGETPVIWAHYFGDLHGIYPWASVTKVAFALSVWIAVERGYVDLDAPAPPPAPAGSTLGDLLAHLSGLDFDSDQIICALRRRRVYSNRGPEIAGQIVAEATGMSPDKWVQTQVFTPLGMDASTIDGSVSWGGRGPVIDLLKLAAELLSPTLISRESAKYFVSPYPCGVPGVLPGYGFQTDNAWGLGVEVRGEKSPHWLPEEFSPQTFGHFGQSGSFIWVDPSIGLAGVFLGGQPFGAEHRKFWPALNSKLRTLRP